MLNVYAVTYFSEVCYELTLIQGNIWDYYIIGGYKVYA